MTTTTKMNNQKDIYTVFKQYGSFPMAYHTLQSSMSYFEYENGYIAYQMAGHKPVVLGDPVTAAGKFDIIIAKFLKTFSNPVFVQISKATAEILSSHNYKINLFGCETTIPLPYSLDGCGKNEIRHLRNCGLRNNISVEELPDRSSLKTAGDIFPTGYNRKQKINEFNFLARPLVYNNEPDVRVFGGFVGDSLIGYSIFDPIYKNGNIIGYTEVISRRLANSPKGSRVFILIEALDCFSSEGIKNVNLGLIPFKKIDQALEPNWTANKLTDLLFGLTYRYGSRLFNFKGLDFHKSRFRGLETPVYFASKSIIPIRELNKIYKLTTNRNWYGLF